MSTTNKPTPTQYKGVRFRSKSEAIFAFHLDESGWNWIYEDEGGASLIHPWDFQVCIENWRCEYNKYSKNEKFSLSNEFIFIEYKPTRPTKTYIENLQEKIKQHFESRINELFTGEINWDEVSKSRLFIDIQSTFYIFWGSPWNPAFASEDRFDCELTDEAHGREATTYCAIRLFDSWNCFQKPSREQIPWHWGFSDEMTKAAMAYRFDLE